ncbi:winged helix DNA-binding domain-containing protein [Paenibacillus rhizovicinus]|uniref:Winged helix DNA-binding domain-containing protein n=1 Tax=Paenibacillus rhizovicinus TaxID=2704463 RepID=A0A6C0P0K2_9BACL|nr:winged helix DNA-binding domain-containing protein [Paenibacillus rhizovicinus]QHW32014.1 winged helix DNA-binding domain-containing protein [Paenibacillus rhizovicinus]
MDSLPAASRKSLTRSSRGEEVPLLGRKALNRALLARQLLLERSSLTPVDAIEHLVGMQSQAPTAPYVGLWSRLAHFHTDDLSQLLADRQTVRIALMRSTIHLVSARDCLRLRNVLQSVHERALKGNFGRKLAGLDPAELAREGRALVEGRPLTFAELGSLLRERCWPDRDGPALANAVRTYVPLVQVTPRGMWGASAQAAHTSAEAWLHGLAAEAETDAGSLLLRYLAAFGPASAKDMGAWSGLSGLRGILDKLRPRLRVFRDEHGAELFDVPDAPLPDENTPAPVRFLAEFDNILLSHADRSRILPEAYRPLVFTENGIIRSAILVGGFVSGLWKIEQTKETAELVITPFTPLADTDRAALADEGRKLLQFAAAGAQEHRLTFAAPPLPADTPS